MAREASEREHRAITCDVGSTRACSITLHQANGVLTCFRGTESCSSEGTWGSCESGRETTEIAPAFLSVSPTERGPLSAIQPTACTNNPCDPTCQWFDDGGPFSPPPLPPPSHCVSGTPMCGYAVFGELEAYVVSDGTLHGDIAAGPLGITLNDGAQAGNLISSGPIDTGTHAQVGSLYSSYVGAANAITIGEDTSVTGAVHSAGDAHVAGGVTLVGELRVGGDLEFSSGNTDVLSTVYSGGSIHLGGESVDLRQDVHAVANVTLAGREKVVHGDIYAGGTLLIEGSSTNSVSGRVEIGENVYLVDGNKTIAGEVRAGGSVAVCASCSTGSITAPTVVTPPLPSAPEAPPALPVLDELRRDTSAACTQARTEPDRLSGDIIVTPGVYGRISPGWMSELRLQGGGSYVFESVELGWRDRFVFEGTGPWDITVCENEPTLVADPRGGWMETPAFVASMGPGARFELATGGVPAPQDVTLYAAETSGACLSLGHVEYSGLMIAPDCDILSEFDSSGVANLWGSSVWTADDVPLSSIPSSACEEGSFWGDLQPEAGGEGCPPDRGGSGGTHTVTRSYEAVCPADSEPSWGLLFWRGTTPGVSAIDIALRTAADGSFAGPWTSATSISTAEGNEVCGPHDACNIDLTRLLFPGSFRGQPSHLELEMTLHPDGSDSPTMDHFRFTYSCVVDQ